MDEIQMRYDPSRRVYRDCKWCGGKGCLACQGEAEKEYKRQFPEGPQPIASFKIADLLANKDGLADKLRSLIGPGAIVSAKEEARAKLDQALASHATVPTLPSLLAQLGVPPLTEEDKNAIAGQMAGDMLVERITEAKIGVPPRRKPRASRAKKPKAEVDPSPPAAE